MQGSARWLPACAAAVMFLIQPVRAEVLELSKKAADTTVHYKVVPPIITIRRRRIRPSSPWGAARRP
jgi:hypothetical protein